MLRSIASPHFSLALNGIAALAETVGADAQGARRNLCEAVEVRCSIAVTARREAVECSAVDADDLCSHVRRIVLRLDAIGAESVELLEVGIETEILCKVDVVAPILVDADRVHAARFVAKCVEAIQKLRSGKVTVVRQRHRGEVVVADHGLVRAVDDCLDGQDCVLDDLAQLLKRKLVGGGCHCQPVLLEEGDGEVVEDVERVIRLYGQLCERACELQRTEVADHNAVHGDIVQCGKELLEFAALTAHGRARCVHDDACASCRIADEIFVVRELPRAVGAECLAADVDGIGTRIHRRTRSIDRANANAEVAARCILLFHRTLGAQHLVGKARLLDRLAEEARFAFARHADVDGGRLSERKCRRVVAYAVVVERTPTLLVRRVAVRVGDVCVNRLAVGRDEPRDELGRAHPPFDFERIDPRLNECGDGAVHTHILECELVWTGTVRVEHFSCRLVDEGKRPAADLHAASTVAALPKEHTRVDALPALGDAHIAVHEVLDLNARACTKERKLGERHLASDDNACNAVLLEFLNRVLVVRVHHDGGVQGDGNAHLVDALKHGEVLHEDRVGADLVEIGKVVAQCGQLLVADKVVERDIELDIVRVCVVDGRLQALVVKVEVALVQPHIEMFAAEIDGIRTRRDSRSHGIPRPCRGKQFDGFSV